MSVQITQGKARVFNFSVVLNGAVNTTAPATAQSGNAANIRVTMNPSNNRQFAVVALQLNGSGTNANVDCGGLPTAHQIVQVIAPPLQDGIAVDEAGVGPEVDPSTIPWA